MKEARYFYVPDAVTQQQLPQEEAQHATRVLRLQPGDEMFLMDGQGSFYRAEVTIAASKHCGYRILEALPQHRTWNGHVHLAIAPTKDIGRMEWMAEKATEIGFDELSFLHCRFSERKVVREDRIEKIVTAAVKQSRKAWMPTVNPLTTFREFLSRQPKGLNFICHCYDEIPRQDFFTILQQQLARQQGPDVRPLDSTTHDGSPNITILVGPEGDFSIDEVQQAVDQGYESVTLGTSRLRTETAGLSAVMMAHLLLRSTNKNT